MSHRNARLTVFGRRLLVERVRSGRPVAHVAAEMGISRATAHKWIRRWRTEGEAGLRDRSSRPRTTPHRTASAVEDRVCGLRQSRKLGPARIGPIVGLPASTVHRILTRHRLNRLAWIDRPTGTVIRRYERERPGELIHVDVKKLGRIPDGGGHKTNGREAGRPIRGMGFDYVHSAVDDHPRLAYSEIHPDEKVATCAGFLTRAAAFFHAQGITRIERVLTDNAWAYRKGLAWEKVLTEIGATGKLTRAYRPQTNGKVERFNRTLLENCQIGVFAAYATTRGRALVDRELYLPKSWTEDRERCRTARVPEEREFATKGELARRTVLRALASPLPITWVTADSAYGQDNRFRRLLEQSGVGYVLAVPKSQLSVGCSRIEGLFAQAPAEAWEKISCGDGAKGPRVYHWAAVRLPAVAEFDYQGEVPHRMRWALARRSISKPDEIAYYLAYASLQVTVQELVRVAGARWAIEECFQAAKNECGLDQYEVRRYVGWYRHITLAMLAHAFLAATAHQSWEKGAEQVGQPGSSGSQWRRFDDSWQLVVPGPRT